MADNVFGNPITNQILESMPEYEGKTITRLDRAHVALNRKNDRDKCKNAQEYVENLKKQWGTGDSTLCLVYNATGDTLTYVRERNWYGQIGPASYPTEIANGQWGAFLHVKTSGIIFPYSAAVVYRGLNNNGDYCDWMAAWSNQRNTWNLSRPENTAYTEIREEGHYDKEDHWNYISNLLYESGFVKSDNWNGCLSKVITANDTNPIFLATFTLVGA